MIEALMEALADGFDSFLASDAFAAACEPYVCSMVVSDFNQKVLRRLANKKEPLSEDEVAALTYIMGKGEGRLDPMSSDDWSDDMVQEYADNLRNFLYTYKESAKKVDPSIDPDEEHRGPMAQDIEKVAPDCVRETPQGIKVVDGNRLALVNAGVIGDLARRLISLEDAVYGETEKPEK